MDQIRAAALQPHEGSSETWNSLGRNQTTHGLQPHEGSSETRGFQPFASPSESFNPTRVRLKLANDIDVDEVHDVLQPHEGSSET